MRCVKFLQNKSLFSTTIHNYFVNLCLGGMKCPECEFIYGTNWELNRHLKSKHGLKLVEGTWEVMSLKLIFVI